MLHITVVTSDNGTIIVADDRNKYVLF